MIGRYSSDGTVKHPSLIEMQLNSLERLTGEQCFLFSLCIAERMSYYFSMYAEGLGDVEGEIDFNAFRQGLGHAWKRVDDRNMREDLITKSIDTENPLPAPKESYNSEVGRAAAHYAAHIVFILLEATKNRAADPLEVAKKVAGHATHIMAIIGENRVKDVFDMETEIMHIMDVR